MKRLAVAFCALALASCGGEDEPSEQPDTGTSDAAVTPIPTTTVGEFIDELQPEKQKILEQIVESSEACEGASVEESFVLLVTAKALDAPQESSIADIVEAEC